MNPEIHIGPEQAGEAAAREALLDAVMGPIRFRRASNKLRAGRQPAAGLALAARDGTHLVGSVRLWNVAAQGLDDALLLGPLAVDGQYRCAGIGGLLVNHAIDQARLLGHQAIILVGDAEYYSRFGFSNCHTQALSMPGPYEPHRLLGLALHGDAFISAHGTLRATGIRIQKHAQAARRLTGGAGQRISRQPVAVAV